MKIEVEKAYKEILKVLNKYKDISDVDIIDVERKRDVQLFYLTLKEEWGLSIKQHQVYNSSWVSYDEYKSVGFFDGKDRYISWSDDGKQPKEEWLFSLSFPTGAYILDSDYPKEVFNKLFIELKTFKPKYVDTVNSSLYFDKEHASSVDKALGDLLIKYRIEAKEWRKESDIKKLKDQLQALEGGI